MPDRRGGDLIAYLRLQQTMAIVPVEQCFNFAFGLADHMFAMIRGDVIYESPTASIDKAWLRQSAGVKLQQENRHPNGWRWW
jgi:urea transport system ATP-binding protein